MYDTTSIRYTFESPSYSNIDIIAEQLDEVTQPVFDPLNGYPFVTGYRDGNRVTINERGFSMPTYSIAKSTCGHSGFNPTLEQVQDEVKRLSDTWQLNMNTAHVWRLDIGVSHETKEKPVHYLNLLQDLPRFNRSQTGDSVYFMSSSKVLCQYDKGAQLRRLKTAPTQSPDLNLIRHELRLKKPRHVLKLNKLILGDLTKPEIFNKNLDLLQSHYQSVIKMTKTFDFNDFTPSIKDHHSLGLAFIIKTAGGLDAVFKRIDIMETSRQNKHRLKAQYRKAAKRTTALIESPLIKELDEVFRFSSEALRV